MGQGMSTACPPHLACDHLGQGLGAVLQDLEDHLAIELNCMGGGACAVCMCMDVQADLVQKSAKDGCMEQLLRLVPVSLYLCMSRVWHTQRKDAAGTYDEQSTPTSFHRRNRQGLCLLLRLRS